MSASTWVLLWVAVFGVWPLAHPDHHGTATMSRVDLVLHFVALGILLNRWIHGNL